MKYMKVSIELTKGQVKEIEQRLKENAPKSQKITKADIQKEITDLLHYGFKTGDIFDNRTYFHIKENGKTPPTWLNAN